MEGDDEDDDVLSDDMKGPVLDTKSAALCAVEAWLERVTSHVEDDASDHSDRRIARRILLFVLFCGKMRLLEKRVEEDVGTFGVA
jgi:hypothetical protein